MQPLFRVEGKIFAGNLGSARKLFCRLLTLFLHFVCLQSNPYGLKDSGPTSDMSWTTAGLQPTTGYYSPYDPTLAAYGWVEIISELRSHSPACSTSPLHEQEEKWNGLLPTKGVDNRRIAIYHVINFIAIFWIETCSPAASWIRYSRPKCFSIDSALHAEREARARLLIIKAVFAGPQKNCLFAEIRSRYMFPLANYSARKSRYHTIKILVEQRK